MGNWKLEAFKMALYMSFPVGAFVIFNSPKFYENAIFEYRQEVDRWTNKDPEFEEYIRKCQREQMQKRITEMDVK